MRTFWLAIISFAFIGCASLSSQLTAQKLDALQLPLSTLDDGASFNWHIDPSNNGSVYIQQTLTKGHQVCRLVIEEETINSQADKAVSTYCLNSSGDWK